MPQPNGARMRMVKADPYADPDVDAAIGVACIDLAAARARMAEAKLAQAMARIAELTRVVQAIAPTHPVLDSVFVEGK